MIHLMDRVTEVIPSMSDLPNHLPLILLYLYINFCKEFPTYSVSIPFILYYKSKTEVCIHYFYI